MGMSAGKTFMPSSNNHGSFLCQLVISINSVSATLQNFSASKEYLCSYIALCI